MIVQVKFARHPIFFRGFKSRGVSLIELLVSMALGLVIVIAIGIVYIGAKGSFKSQNALSVMQENARYAFEFLGNDIRMAGLSGGPSDSSVSQPLGWVDQKNLKNFPLRGFKDTVSTFPTFPVSRPKLIGDALTVIHVDSDNETVLDTTVGANPSVSGVFTLANWPSTAPAIGELWVCADYTHAAAFAISSVNSGSKTVTTTDSVSGFGGAIAARRIYPLNGVTYYISLNPSGESSLYRTKLNAAGTLVDEELVEGVQDMKITYGVDYADPALATNITSASWASGVVTISAVAHGLVANDLINISGATPSTFDGTFIVSSSSTDTFTVALVANPGAFTGGGTVRRMVDKSVDGYWTADAVESGTFSGNAIPGPATAANYWSHVLSVRVAITLASKNDERISTSGGKMVKMFSTTFAVRNRL